MHKSTHITLLCITIDSSLSSNDKESISILVDAICDQKMFTYNEAVDICLSNGQAKKSLLDNKLDTLFSSKEWKCICNMAW